MKLKNKIILSIIFFVAIIMFSKQTMATDTINVKVTGTRDYTRAQEVLNQVNSERIAQGLNELTMDKTLTEIAMQRAEEISLYFSHTRPNGTQWNTINTQIMHGENIAAGDSTAKATMSQWMNSQSHKENILYEDFNSIGIGCFKNGSFYFWVQDFGCNYATQECTTIGISKVTHAINILNENVEVYSQLIKNQTPETQNESGFMSFGFKNLGWPSVYSVGVASDFTFTSSNNNIATIDSYGNYQCKPQSGEVILMAILKADTTKQYGYKMKVVIRPFQIKNLKAKTQTKNSITLQWSKSSQKVTGYEIYKYNSKTKQYTYVGNTTKTTYTVKNLKPGTTYKYKVRAYIKNDGNLGAGASTSKVDGFFSSELSATTKTETPKISKITTKSKKATIKWSKTSGASGYEIYMSTSKNGKYSKIGTVKGNKTFKYTKSKLKKEKKYFFKIRTYRTVAGKKVYSSYSSIKNIKVK